ncbi:MAG TPA: hypothetical protein P5307_29805, partial [Pirellulaceae bacterium]|nr:hypothetical protein [Pirellulaceae bacterium]
MCEVNNKAAKREVDEQHQENELDHWRIVAVCVTGAICGLAALLWSVPTSKWAWVLVTIILLFAVVSYLNPRYKYWRRASWCFGISGALGLLPTFTLKANVEGVAAIEFLSESSPITVLGFLGAGLVLAWIDSRQHLPRNAKSAVESNNVNLNPVNSSNSIAGLEAGRDIVVHQGVSEEVLLAALDVQRIALLLPSEGIAESAAVDEEIVWQLVDDI